MTRNEYIAMAQAYVALSNAHRIDLISPLFDDLPRYRSTAMGSYQGIGEISAMMLGFFNRYPDACWDASDYQCEDATVTFMFRLTATASEDGFVLDRKGKETIEFTSAGLIKCVIVEAT